MKTRLVRQLLVEKDVEIERLNKRVLEFIDLNIANRQLISELADALSHYALLNDFEKSLLQRAQETTK